MPDAGEHRAVILKAPFPYFGGKSSCAALIWQRFGSVSNYVEPFAGSLAVLLARPNPTGQETVNDLNGWICNLWRAIAFAPDAVAEHCDWPVSELDLHARGDALFYPEHHEAGGRLYAAYGGLEGWIERLRADPEFYDPKIAGWWVWGQSAWIGDNWGRGAHNAKKRDGIACGVTHACPQIGRPAGVHVRRKLPEIDGAEHGRGVHRKRPDLSADRSGKGVCRQMPVTDGHSVGTGVHSNMATLAYFHTLRDRLRRVRVCCGDWTRVVGTTPLRANGATALLLDPPYDDDGKRDMRCYGENETGVWADVCAWCAEHGSDTRLRICLAGYDGGWTPPPGWQTVAWKANGGYGNQCKGDANQNKHRERLWFSPGCLNPQQELFPQE